MFAPSYFAPGYFARRYFAGGLDEYDPPDAVFLPSLFYYLSSPARPPTGVFLPFLFYYFSSPAGDGTEESDVFLPVLLTSRAVYWPPGPKGRDGRHSYPTRQEIACRVQLDAEEVIDKGGLTKSYKAMFMVDRDLAPQGVLWPGPEADLPPGLTDPFRLKDMGRPEAFGIVRFRKVASVAGTQFVRRAWC